MNILFYNWAPVNSSGIGGGVAVYLRNLLNYRELLSCGGKVSVLTSGYYYDDTLKPYIRKEQIEYKDVESYTIVNSPIPAPMGILSAKYLNKVIADTVSMSVFDEFIMEHGPFDVIHFQGLEGLSPNVLSLKEKYPNTKFIKSIHDYSTICPIVRFWKNDNTNCIVNNQLEDCCSCKMFAEILPLRYYLKAREGRASFIEKLILKLLKNANGFYFRYLMSISEKQELNKLYNAFRIYSVTNINRYTDKVLAVSKRVKEIVESYGYNKEKTVVSYIGTKVAESAIGKLSNKCGDCSLTILYMGYASVEKGFHFLINALSSLDNSIACNIRLKFASKMSDSERQKLESLGEKFKDIVIYDGYTHSDFSIICKDVNLGIVPPLWEDNLPQVTIEMIANGIPVLTSHNGGAKELNDHSDFVFYNEEDLIEKITKIYYNPVLLTDYWEYSKKLTTMHDHILQLLNIYTQ